MTITRDMYLPPIVQYKAVQKFGGRVFSGIGANPSQAIVSVMAKLMTACKTVRAVR